jgi:hypothetical protein
VGIPEGQSAGGKAAGMIRPVEGVHLHIVDPALEARGHDINEPGRSGSDESDEEWQTARTVHAARMAFSEETCTS